MLAARVTLLCLALLACAGCPGKTDKTDAASGAASKPAPKLADLSYTVAEDLIESGKANARAMLNDGKADTYWCTPLAWKFPLVATLKLAAPATVHGLSFDTRIPDAKSFPKHADYGPKEVLVEALSAAGEVVAKVDATLDRDAVTAVNLPSPASATASLRVTLRSNHGGSYVGITEISVRGVAQ